MFEFRKKQIREESFRLADLVISLSRKKVPVRLRKNIAKDFYDFSANILESFKNMPDGAILQAEAGFKYPQKKVFLVIELLSHLDTLGGLSIHMNKIDIFDNEDSYYKYRATTINWTES